MGLGDDLSVARIGYGAMKLTGWPRGDRPSRETALAVLRRAVELGVNHIDTSNYYARDGVAANALIREALHPNPDDLVIVTKVGALVEGSDIASPAAEKTGLIPMACVGASRRSCARSALIACVQNLYNLSRRDDDPLVDACAAAGIAYVPFFPVGGFQLITAERLDAVAARHGTTVPQVALAWLRARSSNILPIPGTGSLDHLEENISAGELTLSAADIAELG